MEAAKFDSTEALMGGRVWPARYYSFNVWTDAKWREKLVYIHNNPVRAGLASTPTEWRWSSAHFFEPGASVGIPIGVL